MPVQTIELPNSYSYVRSPSPKGTHEDSAASRSSSSSNSQSAIAANLDADNTTSPTSTAKLSSPKQLSGVFGASSNLVNSIVGAGIIGIPYALRESGLIAGLLLLVLVSYLTDKSLRVIVGLASFHPKLRNKDVRTFEDLASFPFGSAGRNFILLNMFIMAYGAMLAYLLIIKDTIPSILGVHDRFPKTLIMIATSFTIMLPLSMQRDMASLSITSLFSVLADIILVGFITFFSPMGETIADNGGIVNVLEMDGVNPTLFIGLGILSTAMCCQHSAFIVSGSLENRTLKRWAQVTGFSITISAILCMILGVTGYLGFLDETQGDVLNNFDKDSSIANVARFLLAVTMFFTFPMESFVARHVLVQLIHGGDMDGRDDPSHMGGEEEEAGGIVVFLPWNLRLNRRQSWSFGIYCMALVPALFVDDLGPVLSITGSLGGGSIAYIGPGLCYMGVNGDAFLAYVGGLLGVRAGDGGGNGISAPTSTADLPLEGTAHQIMTTGSSLESISKPIWWYPLGFPIWTKIAMVGRTNMNQKIDANLGSSMAGPYETEAYSTYDDVSMVPNGREFFIAIFFICFGVLSAVAGVASNVYVQLNRDD